MKITLLIITLFFLTHLSMCAMQRQYSHRHTRATPENLIRSALERFNAAYNKKARTPQEHAAIVRSLEKIEKELNAYGTTAFSAFVNQ
ncbi:MAG: hypothetical protein K2X90_02320 [Candidatus Babeliaceae bacterium]|nr:hypothetical protein [Candidatus Babeliaceae bacterium]